MAQFKWRGIDFQERAESKGVSPVEEIGADRSTVTRVYDVAWADSITAVQALLGFPSVVRLSSTDDNGTTTTKWHISRLTPHALPEWKIGVYMGLSDNTAPQMASPRLNFPFMYATKCTVVGLSPISTSVSAANGIVPLAVPVYKKARITTTYETLPYDVIPDAMVLARTSAGGPDESKWERYVSRVIRPTTEFFTIPANTLRQVGGQNDIISIGVGRMLSFFSLQITWHQVPEEGVPCKMINPDLDQANCIESLIGTVNKADFSVWSPTTNRTDGVSFNKATLLLLGAELKPYRSPFGSRLYDITYMFKEFGPGKSNDNGVIDVTVNNHQKIARAFTTTAGGANVPGWYELITLWDTAGAKITDLPRTNFSNVRLVGSGSNGFNMASGLSIYNWGDFTKLFQARGGQSP